MSESPVGLLRGEAAALVWELSTDYAERRPPWCDGTSRGDPSWLWRSDG
jgi:hypothetical protein